MQETQVRLVHTERMAVAGRVAGGVAHDFNNLLTALGDFAELVNSGVKNLAMSEVLPPAEMDAMLPEAGKVAARNGVKLYRDLRADPELSLIPIVMDTSVLPQFREFIYHRKHVPPPDGYIAKPVSPAELVDTLERILLAAPQA